MTITNTPEAIAVRAGFVRAEFDLRRADRAARTTTHDLIGVERDIADRALVPTRVAAALARMRRDAAQANALAYFDAIGKENQRHERALARIARKYGKAAK
jgi:hypothetical protein